MFSVPLLVELKLKRDALIAEVFPAGRAHRGAVGDVQRSGALDADNGVAVVDGERLALRR